MHPTSGDYVARDKHIHGDEVHGDKVQGDKIVASDQARVVVTKIGGDVSGGRVISAAGDVAPGDEQAHS